MAAGGDDGIVHVWDAKTRRELASWRADHGPLLAARYAPGDQRLALGFEDGTLAVAEGSLDKARTVVRAPDPVQDLAYSGDGRFIAAGLGNGAFEWAPPTEAAPMCSWPGTTEPCLGLTSTKTAAMS